MNIPLGQFSGSDATDRLRESIEQHQRATQRQTRTMIALTWAVTIMTVVMLVGLGVQIWLAWPAPGVG